MSIQQLLESMAERVSASASVKNVYGEPVVVGNRTVIPAAKVRYAFGGGGGKGKESPEAQGGGGGGRVSAQPCGALEVTPEGARFIHFDDRPHCRNCARARVRVRRRDRGLDRDAANRSGEAAVSGLGRASSATISAGEAPSHGS